MPRDKREGMGMQDKAFSMPTGALPDSYLQVSSAGHGVSMRCSAFIHQAELLEFGLLNERFHDVLFAASMLET